MKSRSCDGLAAKDLLGFVVEQLRKDYYIFLSVFLRK